ncbi:MAG TPA: hypothetical protein PKO36_03085 [Candidatus Hydrogenedentes bacterium]|nr:hypothetical protein [Candidatus Hydrogenedentota bacterium]HOT52119.1 hypothetical protein [Candidatus Hydrogenedentota bacterium]HOV73598.1 hypothetical protein [Candidatus Hydrogenedentota bacterium]HPC17215.1 hypothetical protein [Candidatus Hydrogenedentota bacterium]HRT18997.1 hypothetical protein [Candidatus Hydrogenedentota bacterium]
MKRAQSNPKATRETMPDGAGSPWMLAFAIIYTAFVLAVDTLAVHDVRTPIAWRMFLWHSGSGADWFKLAFWFIVPFVISFRRFDWGWFGVARWKKIDVAVLCALAAICALAVLAIPLFPSLRNTYGSLSHITASAKWSFAAHQIIWTFSWLVGWEFLHRCFLLRPLDARWPRWGWLLAPLFEFVYHLQKPLIEAVGMAAFSMILTPWALRRRNVLLPFLAHLAIELELIAFLVLA